PVEQEPPALVGGKEVEDPVHGVHQAGPESLERAIPLPVPMGVRYEENMHVWTHLAVTRGGRTAGVEYHFRRPVRFGGSMANPKLAVLLLVAALTAAACGSRAS